MRVAAIVPAYPPRSRVGAWLATHQFLAHLASLGHNVTVVPLNGADEAYRLDRVDVVRSVESIAIHIANADVVVTHCGDQSPAARRAKTSNVPNVRMAHGKIDDPATLHGAALVVFNSHNLADSVECPSPSIVCRPPVVASKFKTTPGDRVTLINLSEAKGGELFWRLVRCSDRKFLGVTGAYGNQYIDDYPNADVIATTDNMRDDVYSRTRILLMPSERETWGMTAVEAMASGIPVIAHPTEGLLESLGEAGVFVDRVDGQGWLDEIERLHDPDEWAAASALALARSADLDPRADLERFAEAIESLHCTGAA